MKHLCSAFFFTRTKRKKKKEICSDRDGRTALEVPLPHYVQQIKINNLLLHYHTTLTSKSCSSAY